MIKYEMKEFDNSYLSEDVIYVAGADEAGRGPLAGPVVGASVLFDRDCFIEGVDDSKKLSAGRREKLFEQIIQNALSYSICIVDHSKIDSINILRASLLAMKTASENLNPRPSLVLVDGNKSLDSVIKNIAIVKGDGKSFAVAAASILAKVKRDSLMLELSALYPEYHWDKNKGYPTAVHIAAVRKYGPTPYHRKSFLKKILADNELFHQKAG